MDATQDSTQPEGDSINEEQEIIPPNTVAVLRAHSATPSSLPRTIYLTTDGNRSEWIFGREEPNFVLGASRRYSKRHFSIFLSPNDNSSIIVRDMSTNGTWLNNSRLSKNRGYLIVPGDEISVGRGVEKDVVDFVVVKAGKVDSISALPPQSIFARYEISSQLGTGAFATVRKALHRETGEVFAIKMIAKNMVSQSFAVEREIEILKKLKHPYIVRLHDFDEDANFYYLVMDFVGGGDLMDWVTDHGPVSDADGRVIIKQVLLAMHYVHCMGISHRDIKPDNILIAESSPSFQIKISDFGLAKGADSRTFLKTFCGTMAYLAPEVIMAKSGRYDAPRKTYSNKVDIWSIGCLAYVLLTGYLPFDTATQGELSRATKEGNYNRSPLEAHNVSPEFYQFLDMTLQADPEKRVDAAGALQIPWIYDIMDQEEKEDSQPDIPPSLESSGDGNDNDDDDMDDEESMKKAHAQAPQQVYLNNDPMSEPFNGLHASSSPEHHHLLDMSDPLGHNDLRDLDQEERLLPPGTYMILRATEDSIPCEVVYVDKDIFKIGRTSNGDNDFIYPDSRLSKVHCYIKKNDKDEIWFHDLSLNGCIIDGKMVIGQGNMVRLQEGHKISLFIDVSGGKPSQLTFEVLTPFEQSPDGAGEPKIVPAEAPVDTAATATGKRGFADGSGVSAPAAKKSLLVRGE